jgi:DNA-binding SARP family transcriptional activator/predicted ATPase
LCSFLDHKNFPSAKRYEKRYEKPEVGITIPLMSYRFLLLGPPLLQKNRTTLKVDTRKASALLAYLTIQEQTIQRDTLAAFLWPELDQSRARAALRRTLTPLNKALGKEALMADRETVALNPRFDLWVDSRVFEGLADSCQEHGHAADQVCPRCLEPLSQAAGLVRGDFMAGFSLRDSAAFDDWQFEQAERLRRRYAHVLELLAACLALRGDIESAVERAHQWLGLDPLHEPAHRTLMGLYARSGDRSSALQQYRACVRILDEELGVPPLEETSRLYQEILEGRYPSGTAAPVPTPAAAKKPRLRPESPPLVGRQGEWAAILQLYSRVETSGHFLVIEGEIGIGKTRLAAEIFDYAKSTGGIALSTRCYQGESNLAYAPVISALQAVSNSASLESAFDQLPPIWQSAVSLLLPELGRSGQFQEPAGPREPATQSLLFEALRQLIANLSSQQPPGTLVIDDLQWADSASLDLLTYLARRLGDLPLLVIGTWRSADVPAGHPLRALLAESQRAGRAAHFQLERLTPQEVEALAAHFPETPAALRRRLFRETEGLPFIVIEYLLNAPELAETARAIPRSVHDIQLTRLNELTEAESQLLTTAAVIGRSVDYETLREASGRSEEEAVSALEGLVSKNLLVERSGATRESAGAPSYDFTHETLYRVVYDQTSMARRRLLHRRTAEALARYSRTAANPAAQAAQIAGHLQLSGQETRAAEYFQQAGDHARGLFANAEALSHYRSALALGHPQAGRLQEAIGDLLTLNGRYREAGAAFETAAALAAPEDIPHLEQKLGNLHHRRGDFDLAAGHFKAALEALNGEQPGLQAEICADWSRTAARRGDYGLAQELAQKGLKLAAAQEDEHALGQAHNILGIIARVQGRPEQALEHLEKALAAGGGHPFARAAALNNLALVQRDAGNFTAAAELAQEALALCVRLGDRHREAALRNHLADIHHAAGEEKKAMVYLKQAVEIFAEIGLEAGDLQPEIWKLTEW